MNKLVRIGDKIGSTVWEMGNSRRNEVKKKSWICVIGIAWNKNAQILQSIAYIANICSVDESLKYTEVLL